MTRAVSTTITSAVAKTVTQPVYLIYMAWDVASPDVNRYICTWDAAITWNAITWAASGARVTGLNLNGGTLELPNGDDDPWLNLVNTQTARGRAVQVYEHHTDTTASPQTDASLVFNGLMDAVAISARGITITLIEALRNKSFPHTTIDPSVYTHLLTDGDRLYWGPDVVRVQ